MSRKFLGRFGIPVVVALSLFATTALADIMSSASITSTSTNVTYAEVTLSKPASVSGDVLFVSIAFMGGTPATIAPPTGWTLAARTDNDTNVGIASYWKAVGSSEPDSYTWTITPATRAIGGITRYSGLNSINPIASVGGATGRGSSATAPAVATSAGDLIVSSFAFDAALNNTQHFSTPLGMTEKYDVSNNPFGPSLAFDELFPATTGTSSAKTSSFTPSAQRDWVAQQVVLRPGNSLTSGLVSYWKLDESNGDATDSIGSVNLTNNNSASFNAGKINNDVLLNSALTQYLFKSSPSGLPGSRSTGGDMSVNGWVKMSSQPSLNTSQALITLWDGNSGSYRSWGLEYTILAGGDQHVRFVTSSDGMHGVAAAVSQILENGVWHMVSAVYTAAAHSVTIYIDGTAVGTSDTTNTSLFNTEGNAKFMLGAQDNAVDEELDGALDEWGVWNRTLSAAEITNLYNAGSGKQYPF